MNQFYFLKNEASSTKKPIASGKRILATIVGLMGFAIFTHAEYTLTDADVVVTNGIITSCSYTFTDKSIVIPATLDGQTVTGIQKENSFSPDCFCKKAISSVTLPATLQTIGDYAFYGNDLTSVILPNGVKSIGECAFSGNDFNFKTIALPNSVIFIGKYAFSMNGFSNLTLPTPNDTRFKYWVDEDGNQSAGGATVTYSSQLLRAKIDYTLTDADVVVDNNGIITSCSYDFVNGFKDIIIPNVLDGKTVLGINDGWTGIFEDKGIESLVLPSSLKTIGSNAFSDNVLKTILLPEGLESIGDNAFDSNSLTSITLPKSVTFIGVKAFYWNTLTTYKLPASEKAGYVFNGWLDSGSTKFAAGAEISTSSNYNSYTAQFTLATGVIDNTALDEKIIIMSKAGSRIISVEAAGFNRVNIIDISGKMVGSQLLDEVSTIINLTDKANGVYLLSFSNSQGKITCRKVILK
jgi:uncharacterized repeat protein (TIGR02543 family)